MNFENRVIKTKSTLEDLLQGIDLNAIELNIAIRNGSLKIERLFWFICILFSIGMLLIIFLCLHLHKYI